MFESLGFENFTAPQVAVFFALALGLTFGFLAERTGFCLRRALVGEDRRAAAGVWLTALAVALVGTQAAVQAEFISFADHRYLISDLPLLALVLGGALFGIWHGADPRLCVSRLTVLGGTGNLRALLVLLVFAVVAHAMLKGVLAPATCGPGVCHLRSCPSKRFAGHLARRRSGFMTAAYGRGGPDHSRTSIGKRPPEALARRGPDWRPLVPLGWVGTGYILLRRI